MGRRVVQLDIGDPTVDGTFASQWRLEGRESPADGAGTVLAVESDGVVVATVAVQRDRAVSEHFGISAWTVGSSSTGEADAFGIGDPPDDQRADVMGCLLDAAGGYIADVGADLVSMRVDSTDLAVLDVAQTRGWLVRDTIQNWLLTSDRSVPVGTPLEFRGLTVQAHDREELGVHWRSVADRFGDAFAASYPISRFHADPRLAGRAADFYRLWVTRAFLGEWADLVILASRDGEPVAFISGRRRTGADGVEWGSCVHASLAEGGASAVVALTVRTAGFDRARYDIHPSNGPVIGSTVAHGHPRLLGATCALHRWV